MRNLLKNALGSLLRLLLQIRRLLRRRVSASDPARVVILADIGLGNAVMALPLVNSLRRCRPDLEITILTTPSAAVIFRGTNLADRVLVLAATPLRRLWQALRLRRPRFDLCYLTFPTLTLPSELLPLWLGARSSVTHDYRPIQPFFHFLSALYTRMIAIDQSLHDVEQNLALLPASWPALAAYPPLVCSERGADRANRFLTEHGLAPDGTPFCAIHPGGKQGADYKRWPPAQYRELAGEIARTWGHPTIVVLGPDEAALAAQLTAPYLIPLCTNDLEIIIAVLEKSRYFISNDSGIMHVAALLGKPMLTIWGATDWRRNGSRSPLVRNISDESVACRPCIRFIPSGAHHHCQRECLAGISVARVMQELGALLEALESPPAAPARGGGTVEG